MSLHHSFYDIYSQYLFDNFECYNACVLSQEIPLHFEKLATFSEVTDGQSVLDVGCGNGQFLNFLHKKFNNIHTLGIDPSKKQISIAQQQAETALFQQDECTVFAPTTKYDRIFFNESIGYAKDQQYSSLHRYQEMLKPGGCLVVSTFTKHTNERGLNFDKISRNYKQIFEKQGYGLQVLLAVSGHFEYQTMSLNYIKKYFEYSIFEGPKVVQKKWLTKRPDRRYTEFIESELLHSHVIFKIYGPKEKT
jgi:cyclopropane fatty-acyl-phospholipid synthase-like methyltransferase